MNNQKLHIFNQKRFVFAILILLACIFYADKVALGPYATVRMHDLFDTEFARFKIMGNMLMEHGFFAWYPNIAGGMPAYAYQFPPYYILCLTSILIPSWLIHSIMIFFLMVVAGYGMYWFLKDFLKVAPGLSFAGGLIFSLSSQIQPNTTMLSAYKFAFPAFFMCSVVIQLHAKSFKVRLISFLFILFIIVTSYPVSTLPYFCVLQLLIIYFMNFKYRNLTNQMVIRTVLVWTGYIILCIPVLYALYEYIPFVQRTYVAPVDFLYFFCKSTKNCINYFGAWATQSTLFLVIVGSFPLLFHSYKLRRALFVILIPLFLSSIFTEPPLPIMAGSIFEKMDLGHFYWTLPFSLTVFAILAIQEFQTKKVPFKWYCLSLSLAFVLLIPFHGNYLIFKLLFLLPQFFFSISPLWDPKNIGSIPIVNHSYVMFWLNITIFLLLISIGLLRNVFLNISTVSSSTKKTLLTITALLLCSLAIIQCKHYRNKLEFAPYRLYFNSHPELDAIKDQEGNSNPYRVGILYTYPALIQDYGMEGVGCRTPISPRYFKEYFKEIIRPQLKAKIMNDIFGSYWYEMNLIHRWHEPTNVMKKEARFLINIHLLRLINAKYLVSPFYDNSLANMSEKVIISENDNHIGTGLFSKLVRNLDDVKPKYYSTFYIYKLKNVLERGYLVRKAVVVPSDKDVLKKISELSFNELKNMVIFSARDTGLPKKIPQYDKPSNSKDNVKVNYYSPDKIIIDGFVTSPSILVISNSYHPKWTATVNGEKQKIYRANNAFQAIFISTTGKINVILEYKDPLLWKAHYAIPFGLILIGLSVFYNFRRNGT